ncbi:nitrilase-related carbon-nitrogen hydrolase [Sporolactobacillus terrae]|uniref:Amidohydrolase n=1 Tax=Sporolactobacillus terrae TaxID=269673 RepID=A0ABX5Q4U5_9BACL|nr:nitrilase-related carbon-nitrogen hydrolase [Sporolactobacillus terrae]QAA21676.1 amidohydrolase [Sporolactobacillus terrae]QAA24648.1 amidohydrolase [Sporolactobacillus terrae]UAK16484.1 amidohydrolase [Sporolactobacillus terrae]
MSVDVAAIQFEPTLFEKDRNIKKLMLLVEEAAENGAKIITTPEMGITGYCWYDRKEVASYVEVVPGPTTQAFYELAKRYDCYIVIGLPEVDTATNLYYNTAVLIGPEGVVGKHRKTHLYISEPKWAASGNLGHQVFQTKYGKIGLLICMDLHFIETARLVALKGADVICHISNWLAERTPAPYWITRAFENHCYLMESNRWGDERTVQFSGGSCVINPDGHIQSVVDAGDGIAYGMVDVQLSETKLINEETIFADRRPELYHALLTDPYLWNPLDYFGLYGHDPLPPGRRSTVAVAQFNVTGSKQQTIEEFTRSSKTKGAELLVFPEFAMSGFYSDSDLGEEVPGPQTDFLLYLSRKYQIYLVAGLIEREGVKLFNTAVLTGPEGLVAKYRKIHLNHRDRTWASAGDEWVYADLPIGRVGLLIGYDAVIPESARVLALMGCDLIVCPSALAGTVTIGHPGTKVRQNYPIPTGADPCHWHLLRARAGENNTYFAFANHFDPAQGFSGKSGVFGPDTFHFPRQEVIMVDEAGIVQSEIDTGNLDNVYPTNVVRRKDLVMMRLPHYYKELIHTQKLSLFTD